MNTVVKKRRSKTRRDSSPATGTGEAAEQVPLRLADLKAAAREHVENKAWSKLVEIGRMPATAIHETDRPDAETWLLRVKVLGLYPTDAGSIYDISSEARDEATAALTQLAAQVEALHKLHEFDLYLDTRGWALEETVDVFRRLTSACMEVTNADWIRKLRGRALRLLTPDDDGDEDLSQAQRELVASLPDIHLVLGEAYAAAESSGALDEESSMLVRLLRLDLDMRMAEPWDYGRVASAVLGLRGPSADEVAAVRCEPHRDNPYQNLTPRAWAFMWELEHTPASHLAELTNEYPERFPCDGAEGLRLATKSLVAEPGEVDALLSKAVEALMRFSDDSPAMFGEALTVTLADGPRDIWVGHSSLHMASVGDLLLRLLESAPKTYSRRGELAALYRIFQASIDYTAIEEDEDAGDENMPGLAWLCEQSLAFQFAAATVVQRVSGRMRLLFDALRRSAKEGVPASRSYFAGELSGEDLTLQEAGMVLDCLDRLVAYRQDLEAGSEALWLSTVAAVFEMLSRVKDDELRERTLNLAREFSEDLLAKGQSFRLAYLEQVVGDAGRALDYYLINFDTSKALENAAVKNAKLLWARSDDVDEVLGFIAALKDAEKASSRADVVRQLLVDAQTRFATLNQQVQYEKTAINRWPSITGPARKLLGVFASIQRYSSFRELGEYAGMDDVWAERHYNKLVETGMLLVSDKGYRINPHIAPLLERESQHAVIGRIVRAQGTSAVKQVFNSQREYGIYQVLVQLCPNHLVFPNSSLQSIMSFDRMKELVSEDDFGYYLRASVDIVVVSSTTYLPMLAIEVDSVWHDTERQQKNDGKKDRLFAAAGIPFMRLRPVGSPSENTIRAQVAEHVDELVRSLRTDLPGYEQARVLLQDLSRSSGD